MRRKVRKSFLSQKFCCCNSENDAYPVRAASVIVKLNLSSFQTVILINYK